MRVVTPGELASAEAARAILDIGNEDVFTPLANHIRKAFEAARRHQEASGLKDRMIAALRTYRGEYSPEKKREIATFDGSSVYARLTAVKCRGATAILRDIYLNSSVPWSLEATPEPNIPGNLMENVVQLISAEVGTLAAGGQPVDETAIDDRLRSLMDAARKAEKKNAKKEAQKASAYLNDILEEGGFYDALDQALVDLPIFEFACVKGPVVRMHTQVKWAEDGSRILEQTPKLFWERVSPFDLYFSPGASRIQDATVIERIRIPVSDLQELMEVPGYNEDAIREVITDAFTNSLVEWRTWLDGERADLEGRENPAFDSSDEFVEVLEYNGHVRGQWLLDWGVKKKDIPDPDKLYFVTCWLVGRHVIKAQLTLTQKSRPYYYVTSFEKVPGSISGHGLPVILNDIQEVANATLRALVNNLSIASGPQVIVNDDRSAPGSDTDSLYPWKRWHVVSDPLSPNERPVDFFQPQSNSHELLGVYKEFTNMADEISAIPRYLTGSQRTGGAAATASGLAMLMNNASKVMQNVAANIDKDILQHALEDLYEIVMLSQPDHLRGDELIVVKGVTNAIKQEQDRVRQLEFLAMTANPVDAQIVGVKGRASVLRAVAENLGLEYEEIIAEDDEIEAQQQAMMGGPGAAPLQSPDASKSDGAAPRMNQVSNMSTV
jgi:hypothetical protein